MPDGGAAPVPDSADLVAADAAADAPADCFARWLTSSLTISPPVELTGLSTTGDERDPWIANDGSALYFVRAGGSDADIYRATRSSAAEPFANASQVGGLNTTSDDSRVSLTPDQKTAVFASNRGSTRLNIFIATRNTATDAFATPTANHLAVLNGMAVNHFDPFVSADAKRLYFAPDQPVRQHLVVAARGTVDDDFGAPLAVGGISDNMNADADPALSPDERIILFSSHRSDSKGGTDLYYATRPDLAHDFGAPRLVPTVNGDHNDGDPMLSADGCELYFASTRNGNDYDLFVAEVAR